MAEKTYTYYGPMSGVTLPADDAHPKGRQVQFIRGGKVTVPDDNDYIKTLVSRGYLKPFAETTEAKTSSSSTAETTKTTASASSTASTDTSSTKTSESTTTGTTSTTTGS